MKHRNSMKIFNFNFYCLENNKIRTYKYSKTYNYQLQQKLGFHHPSNDFIFGIYLEEVEVIISSICL